VLCAWCTLGAPLRAHLDVQVPGGKPKVRHAAHGGTEEGLCEGGGRLRPWEARNVLRAGRRRRDTRPSSLGTTGAHRVVEGDNQTRTVQTSGVHWCKRTIVRDEIVQLTWFQLTKHHTSVQYKQSSTKVRTMIRATGYPLCHGLRAHQMHCCVGHRCAAGPRAPRSPLAGGRECGVVGPGSRQEY